MEKIKVSVIRAKFPMYQDMSDEQLLMGIRTKYYGDIPMGKFATMIDFDTQREAAQKQIVDDMGPMRTFAAGMGKAFVDTARGAGQLVGLGPSRAEMDEIKQRDAGLMKSTAGTVGNFTGQVLPALATLAIPGAATLRGAAAIGAGMGLSQPVGTEDSRIQNTALGGAAGAGGVAAGRLIGGVASGAKALIDPFTQKGRDKIAGRTIMRFADDASSVSRATGQRTATGAVPTLAEETGDAGLARLQDSVRSLDPQIENRVGQRLRDNNAARVSTLEGLAGDSAQRKAAEAARAAASGPLYQQATNAAYTVTPELQSLLNTPAVKQAMARAKTLAENKGRTVSFDVVAPNPYAGMGVPTQTSRQINGQALQDLKMAMDEMLTDPQSGFAGKAGDAVRDLRGKLVSWMESANPVFKQARTTYAQASKPLNAMDVGTELARRGTSNLSDLSGNPRLQANALLGALRDEPALIERATRRKGVNALSDVFEPNQLNLLRTVASESDRTAAVASAGAGPGSPTAQRLASQNVLERLIGPTGLPTSWAESALANTVVGKPLNLIYGNVAEAKIQQALADAVLDPAKARQFIEAAQRQGLRLPDNRTTRALMQIARTSPAAAFVSQPEGR
jgi:hypothetical protein